MKVKWRILLVAATRLIIIVAAVYLYFSPLVLVDKIYTQTTDGIVISRTLCLLFALWQIICFTEDLFKKD